MRILIAGCGYVGTALVPKLLADGHHVWGLRRNGLILPKGAEFVQADVLNPDTLTMLPSGLDAVVYAVSAGGYDPAHYKAAYVTGLNNFITALSSRMQPIRRFVFVSSTGVYAQEDGEWVDETSTANQPHFSGATLLEGEALVRSCSYPSTILRLGGIYGPGRTRLIDSVRDGSATIPANPSWLNLIHREDCAGMLHHLLVIPKPEPLYLGVDSEPADRRDLLAWVAKKLHVATPPEDAAPPSARSLRGNKRCKNARILKAGYKLMYPNYRKGYEGLLEQAPPTNADN